MFVIMSLSAALFGLTSSHSEGCLFTLLILSFAVQKLLNLIWPYSLLVLFCYIIWSCSFISITLGRGS